MQKGGVDRGSIEGKDIRLLVLLEQRRRYCGEKSRSRKYLGTESEKSTDRMEKAFQSVCTAVTGRACKTGTLSNFVFEGIA